MKEPYEPPSSTARLRGIRNEALKELSDYASESGYCIIKNVTLHFFKDCILAFASYSKDNISYKSLGVYSKDRGKSWKRYTDQFEPAEGYHKAFKYEPHDTSFPSESW